MQRRHLLCCGAAAAAGLFTSLGRAALLNPCRNGLRAELHDVVQASSGTRMAICSARATRARAAASIQASRSGGTRSSRCAAASSSTARACQPTRAAWTTPGVYNRAQAPAWLRVHGYRPTDLHLSTLQRLGADLAMSNVAFDDHPSARRFSGHIETTSVDSIFEWLPRVGYASTVQRIELTR